MPLRDWFRPPRHLLPLFLFITVVPSTLLIFTAWRTIEQDQALEHQRSAERLQQTADIIVTTLDQQLNLAARSPHAPITAPDAISLRFTPQSIEAVPPNRLAYYPILRPSQEPSPQLFAKAEELELQQRDYTAAIQALRPLATSRDSAIQAQALIHLARNQVKSGQPDSALSTYTELANRNATIAGVPAPLFAAWARCNLLEQINRVEQLRTEAKGLYENLHQGHYPLTRSAYHLHLDDARRWAAIPHLPPSPQQQLAEATTWLWNEWKQGRPTNRTTFSSDATRFTILTQPTGQGLSVLIAGPEYAAKHWLAQLAPFTASQSIRIRLDSSHSSAVRRTSAQTGLPWTISLEDNATQSEAARFAARRGLWLAALTLLAALVLTTAAFIARTISRELAVARLQSDFVSSVSHEFRTPLTSLSQLTEILADRRVTDEARRQTYYQAMARQTERLRRLVESLLDFGRMEAGAAPYRLQLIDACALIQSIVDQFEQEASRIGYHVQLNLDGAPATIAADRDALTNVLWNLLDNAVKYSPQCHTVWVHVERTQRHLRVEVRDRGLGIPVSEQKDVFRKFIRGAAAKAEGIPGTGIGLAMVQHIVTAHSGEIQLASAPGEGSTFTVLLPLEDSCPAS